MKAIFPYLTYFSFQYIPVYIFCIKSCIIFAGQMLVHSLLLVCTFVFRNHSKFLVAKFVKNVFNVFFTFKMTIY